MAHRSLPGGVLKLTPLREHVPWWSGIVLAGGVFIKGIDKALTKETGLPVIVAPHPLLVVCLGTGKALEYLDKFKRRKG